MELKNSTLCIAERAVLVMYGLSGAVGRQSRIGIVDIYIFDTIIIQGNYVTCADFLQQDEVDADANQVAVAIFND